MRFSLAWWPEAYDEHAHLNYFDYFPSILPAYRKQIKVRHFLPVGFLAAYVKLSYPFLEFTYGYLQYNYSKQFPQWPPFLDDVRWRSRLVLKFRVFTLKDIDEYRSHRLIIWTILFFIFCYSKNAIRSKTSCLIFFKMIFVKINLWSCSIKRLQNSSALATLIDFDMEKVHRRIYG